MSVPAKRRSSGKGRRNRSHSALKKTTLNSCPKCAKAIKPHTACGFCGNYKGKAVLKVKTKAKSKTAKK